MRDSVPSARHSSICNVLHQWRIWLIPTYRVYDTGGQAFGPGFDHQGRNYLQLIYNCCDYWLAQFGSSILWFVGMTHNLLHLYTTIIPDNGMHGTRLRILTCKSYSIGRAKVSST